MTFVKYFLVKKLVFMHLFEISIQALQRLLSGYCKIKNTRRILKRVFLG